LQRVVAFFGGFGGGKTELAINYALRLAADGTAVILADLDFVTPFFRSREVGRGLDGSGVRLLTPGKALVHADLPVLTPEVAAAIGDQGQRVVLDVGGDDAGARVLGVLQPILAARPHDALFVVNPYRPFTRDVPAIIAMLRAVETAARLRATGFVSNPHMCSLTTERDIVEGHRVVAAAAGAAGLPVVLLGILDGLVGAGAAAAACGVPVLPLLRFMKAPWERR